MRRALALAVIGLALGGCGHVLIQTNDPDARIYADGAFVGKGEVRYAHRTGPPRSMVITVKGASATVERTVKREFTAATLFIGAATLYTGFFWGWQYPENVIVLLPERRVGGWDEAPSGWDAPPAGWEPPVTSGGGR